MLKAIGDALRHAREERGIGTATLAEMAGLFEWQIRDIESGDSDTSIGEICKACKTLGVRMSVQKKRNRSNRSEEQKKRRRLSGKAKLLILEAVESSGHNGIGPMMLECGLTRVNTAEYNRLRRIGLIRADGKVELTDLGRLELAMMREYRERRND